MDGFKQLTHSDNDNFNKVVRELLLFHKVIRVEVINTQTGLLVLDNGTELLVEGNEGCGGCGNGWYGTGYDLSVKLATPSADQAGHGRWIPLGYDGHPADGIKLYKCSVCGRKLRFTEDMSAMEFAPYCHCGTKMDQMIPPDPDSDYD